MGSDRGGSFAFEFEPNGIPFVSKSKGKLSPRSYPIQCKRKWKYSFLSECMPLEKRSDAGNQFPVLVKLYGSSFIYDILADIWNQTNRAVLVTIQAENCIFNHIPFKFTGNKSPFSVCMYYSEDKKILKQNMVGVIFIIICEYFM